MINFETDCIVIELQTEIKNIFEELVEKLKDDKSSEIELLARAKGLEISRRLLESAIKYFAGMTKGKAPRCKVHNKAMELKGQIETTKKTILGEIEYPRGYYHCDELGCKESSAPVDEMIGAPLGQKITKTFSEFICLAQASWPEEQAARAVEKFTGVSISGKGVEKIAKRKGKLVKTDITTKVSTAIDSKRGINKTEKEVERLYTMVDGVWINKRKSKGHEVKAGIIFNNEDRVRNKSRIELLNKEYVGTVNRAEEFGEEVYAVGVSNGIERARESIIIGDGAKWIKSMSEYHLCWNKKILDWYHLSKNVWDTGKSLYPGDKKSQKRFAKKKTNKLWKGKTEEVIKLLNIDKCKIKDEKESINKLIIYLEENREWIINYENHHEKGYLIGSGNIEKTGDILIARRLKLRGMSWSEDGAEAVIRLRQLYLNGDWDEWWHRKAA